MDAKVTWQGNLSFEGTADSGFKVPLGTEPEVGGNNDGFKPMELLLTGLAACTAMDVISILKKKKQDVTDFEVKAHADRAHEQPRIFTHVVLEYIITGHHVDPVAVERSVELSETKYCPAQAMLKKAVAIEHKITLLEAA
jgi:putative redox protein